MAYQDHCFTMDMAFHRKNGLDLILVGKTGNGKSSTGNKILGQHYFVESCMTGSETKEASTGWSIIDGRSIVVCDTPGLCDTDLGERESYEQAKRAFIHGLNMFHEGYHAVIVILSVGSKMTNEELEAIRTIEEMFGGNVMQDYGVIVFTGGDHFKARSKGQVTFEQWCQNQQGPTKTLFQACNYRCVLFDNVSEDVAIWNHQRRELIRVVEELRSRGRRYTSAMFKAIENGWRKAEEAGRKPEIAKKVYLGMGRIGAELNNIVRTQKYDKTVTARLRGDLKRIEDLNSQLDEESRQQIRGPIKGFHDTLDELDKSGVGKFIWEKALPFVGTYILPHIVTLAVGAIIPGGKFVAMGVRAAKALCRLM